jgi:hypothetical protein
MTIFDGLSWPPKINNFRDFFEKIKKQQFQQQYNPKITAAVENVVQCCCGSYDD